MKKILIFTVLAMAHSAMAQMSPLQAAYQQQQWHQQQQMLGHIYSNIQRCGDAHGYGCQQQQTPAREYYPTNLGSAYGMYGVQWVHHGQRSGSVDWGRSERHDGEGLWDSYLRSAQPIGDKPPGCQQSLEGSYSPDNCMPLIVYQNMCAAVATGQLKNGNGDRYYPSYFSEEELARVAPPQHGYTPGDRQTGARTKEIVVARALEICRSDSAVHADSCEVINDNCQLPHLY